MTNQVRCPFCYSSLGPGCDCLDYRLGNKKWEETAAGTYGGGNKPYVPFNESKRLNTNITIKTCILCGKVIPINTHFCPQCKMKQ